MLQYGPIFGGWYHFFCKGGGAAAGSTNFKEREGEDFCTSKYELVAGFSDLVSKVNYYGQLSPT